MSLVIHRPQASGEPKIVEVSLNDLVHEANAALEKMSANSPNKRLIYTLGSALVALGEQYTKLGREHEELKRQHEELKHGTSRTATEAEAASPGRGEAEHPGGQLEP